MSESAGAADLSATRWGATLWAMLAFAAGGALCGFALSRIEQRLQR